MKKHFNHTDSKSGFTMVELSLTLAFIGVLLITIAVITTNIVTIYQKGMTLKAVNSVGRGLIDEFISSINTAPSVDTTSMCRSLLSQNNEDSVKECVKNHAHKFIYQSVTNDEGQQLNGIFCTGYYSYFWNTYYGVDEGKTIGIKFHLNGDTSDRQLPVSNVDPNKVVPVRLARIKDPNYRLCSANVSTSNYNEDAYIWADENVDDAGGSPQPDTDGSSNGVRYIDITSVRDKTNSNQTDPPAYFIDEPTQGMLDSFDLDLTLYELTVFPISQDSVTLRTYMAGTFILATLRGNVDITRTGDYCQPGIYNSSTGQIEGDTSSLGNLGSEFNYCAINKFNFAARTAGV